MDAEGTFTYDASLPTARDRIRFSVGDTDIDNPLRWDETLDALLAEYDEPTATAMVARSLANQFAMEPSSATIPGGPSITYGQRVQALLDLAKAIEKAVGEIAGSTGSLLQDSTLQRAFQTDDAEYRRPLDAVLEGSW